MTKKIQVPRQSDGMLLANMLKIGKAAGHVRANFNIGGFVALNDEGLENPSPALQEIVRKDNHVIETATISKPGFSCTYIRGGSSDVKSPILDEVQFIFNDQKGPVSNEDKIAIIEAITSSFIPVSLSSSIGGSALKEQGELVASHVAILERLESTSLRLIDSGEQFRKAIESEYLKRAEELDGKYQNRLAQLDEQVSIKRKELEEKERDLDRQQKEFDNRENTHVRRELRKQILDEVKRRTAAFRLSGSTNSMRLPIHLVLVLLILVLGASAIYFATHMLEMISTSPANSLGIVVLAVKQVAVSVGFGFSVVFYVKWMNAWASTHAEAEFKVRQFQLDVERASWAVESALEWKDTPDGKMPPELLQSITRGLFAEERQSTQEVRPADELASALFGSAARVRLATGNSEVDLDVKKLRSSPNVKGA